MAEAPFLPQEFIRVKRDRGRLDDAGIERFVRGVTDGSVADAQIAAFTMAAYLNGLDVGERVALTSAMARSGLRLDWTSAGLDGPVLDKHSTGGVGDKVSLVLAPLVAACGGFVPMISGRGLGHTGGTFDKMQAIPGYEAQPDLATFQRVVAEVGCAIVGQTAQLAPADARLYATRDVTATVESIGLITASILSKKLAEGLDALVMDITWGNGAFMASLDAATELAHSIVDVAAGAGLPATALLTDMNQIRGRTAGNAVEVREAIEWLRNEPGDARFDEVVVELTAELLVSGALAADRAEARRRIAEVRATGEVAERFARMVAALGGPSDLIEHPDRHLVVAPARVEVFPPTPGCVVDVDTRRVGLAIVALGGGRRTPADLVDHAVGLTDIAAIGEEVGWGGRPLATVHAATEANASHAATELIAAMTVGDRSSIDPMPVVTARVAAT